MVRKPVTHQTVVVAVPHLHLVQTQCTNATPTVLLRHCLRYPSFHSATQKMVFPTPSPSFLVHLVKPATLCLAIAICANSLTSTTFQRSTLRQLSLTLKTKLTAHVKPTQVRSAVAKTVKPQIHACVARAAWRALRAVCVMVDVFMREPQSHAQCINA